MIAAESTFCKFYHNSSHSPYYRNSYYYSDTLPLLLPPPAPPPTTITIAIRIRSTRITKFIILEVFDVMHMTSLQKRTLPQLSDVMIT